MALALLVAFATQLVNSCGISEQPVERDQAWPGVARDVRVQWTSEPGIDLTEEISVPVRAYLESYDLVRFTGSFDNAYPGFLDAVPPNESPNDTENSSAWDRRPTDKYPEGWDIVGNLRFRILSVERTSRGATVTACEYRYALGQKKPDGTYVLYVPGRRSVDRGIFGVSLNLAAPSDETATHLPPQRGPSLAPRVNVFGGWQITGFRTTAGASNAEWPAKDRVLSDCIAAAPDSPERRERLASGPLAAADFASSPPDPGWPE